MLVFIFNKYSANSENLKLSLAVSNMNQPKTVFSEPTKKLGAARMYLTWPVIEGVNKNHIAVSHYCPKQKIHSSYPFI